MKNSLLTRSLVFVGFAVFALWVYGASKEVLSLGIVIFGSLAFSVLGEDNSSETDDDSQEEPEKHFVNQEVTIYLYDGRKVKGKVPEGISYEDPSTELILKDAQVIESNEDSGDVPKENEIHDEILVQACQISFAARDNPDRPTVRV